MTNKEIVETALRQSAIDCACGPGDFLKDGHTLTRSRPHPEARRYLELPHICNFVTYGSGVVVTAGEAYMDAAAQCLALFPPESGAYRLFETPGLHEVNGLFAPLGGTVRHMAEYFLPDADLLRPQKCPYETRLLTKEDFSGLYTPAWSNALCEKRRELDVLGVGAYCNGTLVGLAGCSADCETMWQIGVDVLPAYRKRGVASALTSRLALEIMERGKVPFYCAAWSNLPSVRNALRSGFRPAWVELTVKRKGESL